MSKIVVPAKEHATRVGPVRAGVQYRIRASGTWHDWWVPTDALGYPSKLIQHWFEHARLVPNANWFALCGALAPSTASDEEVLQSVRSHAFDLSSFVKSGDAWTPAQDGILYVFPNDVYNAYWNNWGEIEIEIEAEA